MMIVMMMTMMITTTRTRLSKIVGLQPMTRQPSDMAAMLVIQTKEPDYNLCYCHYHHHLHLCLKTLLLQSKYKPSYHRQSNGDK